MRNGIIGRMTAVQPRDHFAASIMTAHALSQRKPEDAFRSAVLVASAVGLGDRPARPAAAFTVGLASFIAVLEGLYFFQRDEIWLRISQFRIRIFAVSFAMGVVTGIMMPSQFGTNWARFSDAAANVISPMLARTPCAPSLTR